MTIWVRNLALPLLILVILTTGACTTSLSPTHPMEVRLSLDGDLEISLTVNQDPRMVGWYVANVANRSGNKDYLGSFMCETVMGDYRVRTDRDGKVAVNLHPNRADDNIVLYGEWKVGGQGDVFWETDVGPYKVGTYRIVR